jgi:hypothetical protein
MASGSVECYSGHTYAHRPRAFQWDGERYSIVAVVSQWRTPGEVHYIVRTEKERGFLLRYDTAQDTWEVESL